LEELVPNARKELTEKKIAAIPNEKVRELLRRDPAKRSVDESQIAVQYADRIYVSWREIALSAPAEDAKLRTKTLDLANNIKTLEERIQEIDNSFSHLNIKYWDIRVQAESTEAMQDARRLTYEADQLKKQAKPDEAIARYDEAWLKWRKVFNEFPLMRDDSSISDDVMDEIKKYRKAHSEALRKFPENFILQDVVEIIENQKDPNQVPLILLPGDDKPGNKKSDQKPDAKKSDQKPEVKPDEKKADDKKVDALKDLKIDETKPAIKADKIPATPVGK
jgi:hypothetical protein